MVEKVNLSGTSLKIVPIIFGGNVFSWTLDENSSMEMLDSFEDLGFNAIDTANQYSYWVPGNKGGESETIIGSWMKNRGNRDKIVLMTKVGGVFANNPRPNTSRAHIIVEVENSLKRLQTDYIDLYQTHFDDLGVPVEETLRAYEELIKQGKVRYIGASNLSSERLESSLLTSQKFDLPVYKTLQPEYNLYSREKFEREYLPLATRYNLSVIPFYSLASGFLTGKYRDTGDFSKSERGQGVRDEYWNDRGKRIISTVMRLSEEHGASASAVSLAWLLSRPTVVAPIASATKYSHIVAFYEALKLKLSSENLVELDTVSSY